MADTDLVSVRRLKKYHEEAKKEFYGEDNPPPSDVADSKVLRITPTYLRKSERVFGHVLIGLREEALNYVIADGNEYASGMPESVVELYSDGGDIFWRTAGNQYYRLSDKMNIGLSFPIKQVVNYVGEDGAPANIFVGERIYGVGATSMRELASGIGGGTCAAVYDERLFIGNGSTISYCSPLNVKEFDGKIALSATGGDVLEMLSFEHWLYVFREHEILRIKEDASDIGFRIETVYFYYGAHIFGSVQPCGEKFVFFTERGLVVGDGFSFQCIPKSYLGIELVMAVREDGVHRACTGYSYGKYYALVTKGEQNYIFVYEPKYGRFYFLETESKMLAGSGGGVYIGHDKVLYRLTENSSRAFGEEGGRVEAKLDISKWDGSIRYIDRVSVTGKGNYSIVLETESGAITNSFEALDEVQLSEVLSGASLKFQLTALDVDSVLHSLNIHLRDEG